MKPVTFKSTGPRWTAVDIYLGIISLGVIATLALAFVSSVASLGAIVAGH